MQSRQDFILGGSGKHGVAVNEMMDGGHEMLLLWGVLGMCQNHLQVLPH